MLMECKDAPAVAVGVTAAPAIKDLVLSYETFGPLVCNYQDHKVELLEHLENPTLDKFTTDEEVWAAIGWEPSTTRSPTTDRVPPKELEEMVEPIEIFYGSQIPLVSVHEELMSSYAAQAIRGGAFPNARLEVVICGRSLGIILHPMWKLQRMLLEDRLVRGVNNERKVSFHVWRDFNHAVCDHRFTKAIRTLIHFSE